MLGFPILYCKGVRPMMLQLSGFCYKGRGEKQSRRFRKRVDPGLKAESEQIAYLPGPSFCPQIRVCGPK